MSDRRGFSDGVKRVGRDVLRLLQKHESITIERLAAGCGKSKPTVKRAIEWLRQRCSAPLEYIGRLRAWRLMDKSFALPLADPTPEDLQAALTAAGLLDQLGQERAAKRARALFDEFAQRMEGAKGPVLRAQALRVTQTSSSLRDPRWLLQLLGAAGRAVFRIGYHSPWKNEHTTHLFEPWQVWLHDGVFYVRGHSRTRRGPRTFRVANVTAMSPLPGDKPTAAVPEDPWSGDEPRYGIDNDRPGEARLRFVGPVARWVAGTKWHAEQVDTLTDDALERRVRYRSCRELARRLAAVGDGLDLVEPAELRDEVLRIARETQTALQPRCSPRRQRG